MTLYTGVSRTTQQCSYSENNGQLNDAVYRCISRVSDQNGVSLLYIMLEMHHSDREPSICIQVYQGLHSTAATMKNNGKLSNAVYRCIKDNTAL